MAYFIGISFILALLGLDQAVKQITIQIMDVGDSFPLINGLINFTSVRNTGAAWNLFDGELIFLIIITVIALVIFGYFFLKVNFTNKKLYSFSISMTIAGTLGNMIDRLFYPNNAVVDMFEFAFMPFPVFNIADMCLVIGIILFAIDYIFLDKPATPEVKNDGKE